MRAFLLAFVAVAACSDGQVEAPRPDPGVWSQTERDLLGSLRLDLTPRPDPSNRYAESPQAIALGQALFFDADLSPSGEVSCATCHDPARGFADGRKLSQGVGTTTRNAPTVLGTHF